MNTATVDPSTTPPSNSNTASGLTRQDYLIGIILVLIGIASRYPFRGEILYHWDSINMALALAEFDIAKGQPHVPGYLLYIMLGRLVNLFFNEPQAALTTLSIMSSGVSLALLYGLGKSMFNRAVGLTAALFLFSSPLFWFYGEIALPHTIDTVFVLLVVWLLYEIMQGHSKLAVPTAFVLAIGGGLRPQTEVFLGPLLLFAGWRLLYKPRHGWKPAISAIIVLIIVNLFWFIPLLGLSGGPTRYFAIMGDFSARFQDTTSVFRGAGWFGLSRNLIKLSQYTLYAWAFPLIPMLIGTVIALKQQTLMAIVKDKRFWFIVVWIGPTLFFYSLIHMGQQGLVFVFLPALLLWSAVSLFYITWPYRTLTIAALIILNSLIFLAAPTYPLGGDRPKLLTAQTLAQHDNYYQPRFTALANSETLTPEHTAILASDWRFPQYYLPEYPLVRYEVIGRWELGEGQARVAERTLSGAAMGLTPDEAGYFYVVLFNETIQPFNQSPDQTETLTLKNGQTLPYLRFTAAEQLYLSPQSYEIRSLE